MVRSTRNAAGWSLVCAIVGFQWVCFRQCALREFVWSYPAYHDQTEFIEQSYLAYQRMDEGAWSGLLQACGLEPPSRNSDHVPVAPSPQQFSFTAQGALMCRVLGPRRLSLLTLSFIYFAAFQLGLVATVRWLSGKWSIALIALALLVSSNTQFFVAGGLFDFRLDFAAMCLWGLLICLLIRSQVFQSGRWSAAAGGCASLLFTIRFISLVYLSGVFALLAIAWCTQWRRGPADRKVELKKRAGNALLAAGIVAAVAGPIIAQRFDSIRQYYLIGHLTGAESQLRAAEQGVQQRWSWDDLSFYPRCLGGYHAGEHWVHLTRWVLLAAGLLCLYRVKAGERFIRPGTPISATALICASCFVFPLVVLTLDQAKSPVVADVLLPPLIWAIVLLIMILCGTFRGFPSHPIIKCALALIAGIALSTALISQHNRFIRPTAMSANRQNIDKLLRIYDRMWSICRESSLDAPKVAFDSTSDALNAKVFAILTFERHGTMLHPVEVLANSIFARPPAQQVGRLSEADLAVLTEDKVTNRFQLPFDSQMQRLKPGLFFYAQAHFQPIASERLGPPFNCDLTLFARRGFSSIGVRR